MERVLDLEVPVVTKGQVAPDAVDYARVKIAHAARHGAAPALHAVVRLTQAADPLMIFTGWGGDISGASAGTCTSDSSTCVVAVSGPRRKERPSVSGRCSRGTP